MKQQETRNKKQETNKQTRIKEEVGKQKSDAKKGESKKVSSKPKSGVIDEKKSAKETVDIGVKIPQTKSVEKSVKQNKTKATTMEELLANAGTQVKGLKQGTIVEGLVTDVSKRMVLVDIGAKTEGMVVDREYEGAYELIKDLKIGDKIKAIVVSPENDRGQILLSLRRAATDRSWDHFVTLMDDGAVLIVRGLEINKGGLIVRADGTRGFIPSSQFGKALSGKMDDLINRPIKVKVIEVDKEKNRLIFSERHVSEAEALEKKADALKLISVGDILEGTVSGVMPFGAFVTVKVPLASDKKQATSDKFGEVEGLVHISEISWEKVEDPNKYFRAGQTVKVKVLSIDQDAGKLNLSVKRLASDPWDGIEKKFKPGSKQSGVVTRVEPFGVFVNFQPGVDGLIHISKIPAGEEPVVDQKVDVYVETIDAQHRRMSLSMVLKTTEKLIYK